MTDLAFSELVSRASPSVPGCPFATVRNAIRNSAIKTCERTLAYRYEAAKKFLLPGVFEYSFPIPANTECAAIIGATLNGSPLDVLTLEQAIARYPDWPVIYSGVDPDDLWALTDPGAWGDQIYNEDLFAEGSEFVLPPEVVADGGAPLCITQVTVDKYVVLPMPDDNIDYYLKLFLALKPTRTATGMETVALRDLEDTILHGALEELLVTPNVSWADRELAAYHAKQYLFHTTARRARANLGVQRGTLTVKAVPFS